MKSFSQFEKSIIGLNIVLICIVISLVIYIYIRTSKENYDWNMNGTVGNIYPTGNRNNNEFAGHAFQTQTGTTGQDYTLYMGSQKASSATVRDGASYIQSVQWGTDVAPLDLNYRGGIINTGGLLQAKNGIKVEGARMQKIDSGSLYTGSSPVTVNFNITFSKVPIVVCSIVKDKADNGVLYPAVTHVASVSTTSFSVYFWLFDTYTNKNFWQAGDAKTINWIAIETL